MKGMVFENEIWDFLRTISECMANAFRPIVEEYGLTIMQTRILVEIKEGGPHTIGSLGAIIGITGGNASSMFKKLEKAGFLRRIRNPEDERCVQLALTEVGEETIKKIEDVLEQKYGAFLKNKNKEEFQTIFACMEKVSSFLMEMSKFIPDKTME
ncbi:MarR family winged helix-turn-helix transcriptional regulator [Desulfosporosinus nitroreducens]|uniref:MarR family transcriptional regulator n=1 Tax=Desulfosporosinus nitroreducens TaxID=2018668 RepID=A0ABT8QSJ5_9FIRM|nr:MarR family transcriptional regulator [Desulfosporosinus nitroreducens]MCO1599919.1 MarR family transcriptional regulator [Desulfosporosinus nitroreducens]MDO0823038.1 MarR family transcriptional regulator [Desulfosporosinus nitroreducens]